MKEQKNLPAISYDEGMAEFYRSDPKRAVEIMSEAFRAGDQEIFMEVLGALVKSSSSISALSHETGLHEKNTAPHTFRQRQSNA